MQPMSEIAESCASAETPMGRIGVVERDGEIVRLLWACDEHEAGTPLLVEALKQVEAYFAGTLKEFDLPLAPSGTAFEQQVFDVMKQIPFGETRTYGSIAKQLDGQAQPVGNACGANPIPIIIPCHRVVGASGLGGFSGNGGVEIKVWLLRHESAYGLLL